MIHQKLTGRKVDNDAAEIQDNVFIQMFHLPYRFAGKAVRCLSLYNILPRIESPPPE